MNDAFVLSPTETQLKNSSLDLVVSCTKDSVVMIEAGAKQVSEAKMVEAIAFDKRKIVPVCALLEGEYGVNGLFIGVPAILGKNGVEKIIEMDLKWKIVYLLI